MNPVWGSREAQTTLPCPQCSEKLRIARTCHEVFMRCPGCGRHFDLAEYISKADEAMEEFLASVYCDRI